jgi:hypothetical protein
MVSPLVVLALLAEDVEDAFANISLEFLQILAPNAAARMAPWFDVQPDTLLDPSLTSPLAQFLMAEFDWAV